MKIELIKKEGNKVEFEAFVDYDRFNQAINKVYTESREYFRIPGFRKGKAPRQIIEMNYGKEIFYEDALNELLPEIYQNGIEKLDLKPIDQPDLDIDGIKRGEDIKIRFEVEVIPEVELGEYKDMEVEYKKYRVTEDLVNKEIDLVREKNGRLVDGGDKEIEYGDTAVINFKGSIDGEEFEGGSGENYHLKIGSSQFIPGFEDQLVGKKKGENVKVQVAFPEDYHEEGLAGKESVFDVDVLDLLVLELPELDDEFVMDVSDYDSLDEYRQSIREELEKRFEESEKIVKENKSLEKLVEITEMEIPEKMVENKIDDEIRDFSQRLASQGLDMETYLMFSGMKENDLRDEMRESAYRSVGIEIALEQLVKDLEIEVTEEDIDKEYEEIAKSIPGYSIEQLKAMGIPGFEDSIKKQKAIKELVESVKFIELEDEEETKED